MSKPVQTVSPQPRTTEVPFEIYKRRQAALARYRLYSLTVFYTLFAILMVIIGISSAHPWTAVLFFSAGCVTWTLIEYLFHRYVLHGRDGRHISGELKDILPLFFFAAPISLFFPVYTAPVLLAGVVQSYVAEEWLHYALHFWNSRFPLFRRIKKYYLYHHSPRGIDKGYGITTRFWDGVFDTRYPEVVRRSLSKE
jgi:sterol desaturase/sphingolipid hydroxylase (fatty acid hydroxylase superfamily)